MVTTLTMRDRSFMMRTYFLKSFFCIGIAVGGMSVTVFHADAGVVDAMKNLFASRDATVIVNDAPDAPVSRDRVVTPSDAATAQTTFDDDFVTRAMIDASATNALWREASGDFTLARATGVWMEADGATAGENIVATGDAPRMIRMVYDSDRRPVMAWEDAGRVRVQRWNGTRWQFVGDDDAERNFAFAAMTCASATVCAITEMQMIVDDANVPVVAWIGRHDDMWTLFVARWNGATWATDRLASWTTDETSRDDVSLSLVSDAARHPALAFATDRAVRFLRWDGTQWVGAGGAPDGDVVLRATATRLRLVYNRRDNAPVLAAATRDGVVHVSAWRGDQWRALGDDTAIIEDYTEVSDVHMVVDARNAPIVAIIAKNDTATDMVVRQWRDEKWQRYTTPLTHGEDAIAMAASDDEHLLPLIACYGRSDAAKRASAGLWTGAELVTLDDGTPGMTKVAKITSHADDLAIFRVAAGDPVIAWRTGDSLYAAQWHEKKWMAIGAEERDARRVAHGGVQDFVFVSTPQGEPAMAWLQTHRGEQRAQFAFMPTVIDSPRVVQSAMITDGTTDVVSATLTADVDAPDDARVTFALTADGGATWWPARNAETVTFERAGTDVRWRAQLHKSDDDDHVPTLGGVRITYTTHQTAHDGACGAAARTYKARETRFDGALCDSGVADTVPRFPQMDEAVEWSCRGGSGAAMCRAERAGATRVARTPAHQPKREAAAAHHCVLDAVSHTGATTATLRVRTDAAYAATEMKFKVEAEDAATHSQVFGKSYGVPADDGTVHVSVDGLQPRTRYAVKVKMLVGGTYVFCPTARTTTTPAR